MVYKIYLPHYLNTIDEKEMNYNNTVTNKTIRSTTPISKLTFFLTNPSMIPTSQSIQSPTPSQYNISTNKIGSSLNIMSSHKNPQTIHQTPNSQQGATVPIAGQYATPKNSYEKSNINKLIHSNPDIYQQLKQRQMDYINLIKDLHLENCRLRTMLNNHQLSPQMGTQNSNGKTNAIHQVIINNNSSYTAPNMNPSAPTSSGQIEKQSANKSSRSKLNSHTRTPSFNSPEKSIPPNIFPLSPSLNMAIGNGMRQSNQNPINSGNCSPSGNMVGNVPSENIGSIYNYIHNKPIINSVENHSIFSSDTNPQGTLNNMIDPNKQQPYPNRKTSIDNHNSITYSNISPNIGVNINSNAINNNSSVMTDNESVHGKRYVMGIQDSLVSAAQRFSFADRQEKANSNLMGNSVSKETLQAQPVATGTANIILQATNQQNIWKIKTNKSIPYPYQDQYQSEQNQQEFVQNNSETFLRIKSRLKNQGIGNDKGSNNGSIGARAYVDATDQEQGHDTSMYINSNTPSIKYYINNSNHTQHLGMGINQQGRMKIVQNRINTINSNAYTNFDENQYSYCEQDRALQYSPSLPNQTSYSSIPSLLESNSNSIYANMDKLKRASDSIKNQQTHTGRRISGFAPLDANDTLYTQNIHESNYDKNQGYDGNANRLQKNGTKDKRKYIKNSVYL